METGQTYVVKLGTSVLTGGGDTLDKANMVELVRQCAELMKQGNKVILVSSGAVAAGREHFSIAPGKTSLAEKQMLAAVGQSHLVNVWQTLFALYGIQVGQMLLTRADLEDRERYLNARDTLQALLKYGVVPVINENDAVATQEIKVGDNDNLSALVAILANADKLLLLTDQAGLFNADPRTNPDAELISEVRHIDEQLRSLAGGSGTHLGTGGMATKLQAASVARHAGVEVIISAGHGRDVILQCVNASSPGTRFVKLPAPADGRKKWLLAGPASAGKIEIDAGAANAISEQGASLLAKGISGVNGRFKRGDLVDICLPGTVAVARGVVRYSADELRQIKGLHSSELFQVLGYDNGTVVVHRDDLIRLQDR